jgi:hypothetical protein
MRRLSKRKAIAYVLSAAIFAGAVWMALRLSFPPDPLANRGYVAGRNASPLEIETKQDTLTIHRGKQTRSYRFRQTREGVVAEEIENN